MSDLGHWETFRAMYIARLQKLRDLSSTLSSYIDSDLLFFVADPKITQAAIDGLAKELSYQKRKLEDLARPHADKSGPITSADQLVSISLHEDYDLYDDEFTRILQQPLLIISEQFDHARRVIPQTDDLPTSLILEPSQHV